MGTPWRRWLGATVGLALLAVGCRGAGEDDASGTRRVPDDYSTIQEAVDAAEPGDLVLIEPGTYEEAVDVTTDDLVIRGLDRNDVVLDGGFELGNGIRILEADGVAVENLTVQNFTDNGLFWTGVDGYRASYVSAIRYGVYAFGSVNGVFEHSYASGSADGGFYIGQCFPCDAVVDDVVSEWNGMGFSDTDAGGDLVVVGSVFRENRLGFVAASATFEGCYPQREATFVGNRVLDNGNPDTAAVGLALLADGVGVGVGGGIGNVIERNVVSGNPRAGIAVIPFPEYDAIAPIPAPEDRPVDCVADATAADEEVIAGLDNPLLWPPEDNQVRENDVADNGEWDLVVLTLDGEAHGNCFEGNELAADAVLAPPEIEAVLPCEGEPQAFVPELARFLEIVERELPDPPSYQDVDLPDPGLLAGMDDPESAPAEPAGPPPPVDLDAITTPDAG